jgi:hypothetical protein
MLNVLIAEIWLNFFKDEINSLCVFDAVSCPPRLSLNELERDIPGSSLHIIPQAGHFLIEDKPKEVSEIIEAFIRKKADQSMELNKASL